MSILGANWTSVRRVALWSMVLLVLNAVSATVAFAKSPRPFGGRVVANWNDVFLALPPQLGGAGLAKFNGTSQVTHMGRTAQAGQLTLGFPTQAGVFPGTGSVTMTAANGDKLSFNYVGTLNPATGEGIGTFVFTGGTGRFAGATGGGQFYALIDLSSLTKQAMTVVLDGTIVY